MDENLTEEERKAAWEEFENEKKGFVNVGDPQLQSQIMQNINPTLIQVSQSQQQQGDVLFLGSSAFVRPLQVGPASSQPLPPKPAVVTENKHSYAAAFPQLPAPVAAMANKIYSTFWPTGGSKPQ